MHVTVTNEVDMTSSNMIAVQYRMLKADLITEAEYFSAWLRIKGIDVVGSVLE